RRANGKPMDTLEPMETVAREIRVYDARLAAWRTAGAEDADLLARYGLDPETPSADAQEPESAEPAGDE
ncbi:MAG: hypothetical protein ACKOWF_16100, partial [Chloroflexota bacterium]